jgi:flagellar motility protein MotE (MotC chaperone)
VPSELDYHDLDQLRRRHPAWRLLAATNAPLVISCLQRSFIVPNHRSLPQGELVAQLEDLLFELRQTLGEDAFPRTALGYLSDWSGDERGWLRRYYRDDSDEAQYDLTPAAERALDWVASLEQRQFIGTESRLLAVFELLQQLVQGTETDPAVRIAELKRQRAEIDAEIQRAEAGELALMDSTQVKERFFQVEQTARALLSDFRQVEQNFRELDRAVRERITTWDKGKGALLAEVFGDRDAITDSDQGRSFQAFWGLLMSPAHQERLSALLRQVLELPAVAELKPDRRLVRVHYDWLEAGESAQRTVARLSEQLRKFLDDQAWLENRRIMDLLHEIEQRALAVRAQPPGDDVIALDEMAPRIELVMERPLFRPPFKPRIDQVVLEAGSEAAINADALFEQVHVDKLRLAATIRKTLQRRDQIALSALVAEYPLQQGLAELVAYLSLAAEQADALIDDRQHETIRWTDAQGVHRQARLPTVIFVRPGAASQGASE